MCLLIVTVQRSSPWQHASIHPGLVSLLSYHPYIPSFKSIHLLVSFLFLLHNAYYILCFEKYIARGSIFIVVYTLVFMSCCRNCVMYVRQLSLLQLLIWASYRHYIHFKESLSEAICCCLQTCTVDVVLLVMYCMYIPAF